MFVSGMDRDPYGALDFKHKVTIAKNQLHLGWLPPDLPPKFRGQRGEGIKRMVSDIRKWLISAGEMETKCHGLRSATHYKTAPLPLC
jgi:hypothetical protein